MNEAVVEFIEYLTQTKNYSPHTALAYDTDIRDFLKFYEDFSGSPPFPRDLSRVDTICFRSYLANRQKRGLSHKSTARALSSLRGFYKYLARTHGVKNDAIGLISVSYGTNTSDSATPTNGLLRTKMVMASSVADTASGTIVSRDTDVSVSVSAVFEIK